MWSGWGKSSGLSRRHKLFQLVGDGWFGKDSLLWLILSNSLRAVEGEGIGGGKGWIGGKGKGMSKEEDRGWNGRV